MTPDRNGLDGLAVRSDGIGEIELCQQHGVYFARGCERCLLDLDGFDALNLDASLRHFTPEGKQG